VSSLTYDGIALRPLRDGDRRTVLEVFAGLSERSRRLRFLGPKPKLSDRDLEVLVDIERRAREALVAVEVATGRAIGIARFARVDEDPLRAEIAFAVVDHWQGRGVGSRLAEELAASLHEAGIERAEATLDVGNEPARALLHRLGRIESNRFVDGELEVVVALER
jgi:RimJ/RimL family protein N-acetyltransferase